MSFMKIIKAEPNHLEECAKILFRSELGKRYYPNEKILIKKLGEGMENDEFFVATSKNEILGFIWFTLNGAFSSFPYLHIVVVDEKYRNRGIGKELIKFYESYSLSAKRSFSTKSFLVVANFNENAHNMYKKLGYSDMFEIDGLFRKGIKENLMSKNIVKEQINKNTFNN